MGGDQDLNLTIRAKDEATETIKKVEKSLGDVTQAQEKAGKSSEGMSTSVFKGVLAYDALKQGLSFAIGFLKESIQESMEASRVQAQLGAVLKSTGGAAGVSADMALELAQALQKQTTFGDEAILSAENMLLTFTKIKSDVFPEAIKTVLDMSTALGQDTKNSAIQLGKALNDPITGVSALRKVGVTFNETQQETIEKLVKSGKVMEAQKIILKELAVEFGGSAAAEAKSFAGEIKKLENELSDVKEEIGNKLMPIVLEFVRAVSNNMPVITTAIGGVIKAFEKLLYVANNATGRVFEMLGAVSSYVNAANDATDATLKYELQISDIVLAYNKLHRGQGVTVEQYKKMEWAEQRAIIRGSNYRANIEDLGDGFENLGGDAEDAKKSIEKAEKALEKFQKIASGKQDLASTIVDQELNIKGIQDSIAEKEAEMFKLQTKLGTEDFQTEDNAKLSEEVNKLKQELSKESEALSRVRGSGLKLDPLVAEARRRSDLTDFERRVEDISSSNFGIKSIVPAAQQAGTGSVYYVNFNSTVAGDEGVKKIIKETIDSLNRSTSLKTMGGV